MTMHAGVDRRQRLTHAEFVSDYLYPLRPVILTDAINHWRALGRWTPQFFRTHYGSRDVVVDGQTYALADLVSRVEASTRSCPAPYLRNLLLQSWAPELMADITPLPGCAEPNWLASRLFPADDPLTAVELYIGGAGARFPVLHYDHLHTHAFLMQLHGTKEYIIFAPDQAPFLYPRFGSEINKSQIDDIEQADLRRFPLFTHAAAQRTLLNAGETLFVPAGWWHTARILDASVTVSANTANAANWPAFKHDYVEEAARHGSKWRARALAVYLLALGCFEHLVSVC